MFPVALLSSPAEDFPVLVDDFQFPDGNVDFTVGDGGYLDGLDEGVGGTGFQLADHHHTRIDCTEARNTLPS